MWINFEELFPPELSFNFVNSVSKKCSDLFRLYFLMQLYYLGFDEMIEMLVQPGEHWRHLINRVTVTHYRNHPHKTVGDLLASLFTPTNVFWPQRAFFHVNFYNYYD